LETINGLLIRCISMERDNFKWIDSKCEKTKAFFFCEYGTYLYKGNVVVIW
jgi:hypothetical protein